MIEKKNVFSFGGGVFSKRKKQQENALRIEKLGGLMCMIYLGLLPKG
jgi:hypothetical protein